MMVKKILVATDGSDLARKAAEFAIGLAVQTKAEIVLINVIDTTSLVPRPIPESSSPLHIIESMEDYLREAAAAFMEEIAAMCGRQGVPVEQVIQTGDTVEEILSTARLTKSDMIVIGSHGHGALKSAVLGSVAYSLIHQATKIPVLVVR
jgi:nucleotide-binding universal stress UspA family protein